LSFPEIGEEPFFIAMDGVYAENAGAIFGGCLNRTTS
jgi:hypothetical protein